MTITRKPYSLNNLTELQNFALKNRVPPFGRTQSAAQIERFLNRLTSSPDGVIDIFSSTHRCCLAVIVDTCQNPSNSASLELLAIDNLKFNVQEDMLKMALTNLVSTAKEFATKTQRDYLDFEFHPTLPFDENFLIEKKYKAIYKIYEMSKRDLNEGPKSESVKNKDQEHLTWQTVTEENLAVYYKTLVAAFSRNLETSIPPYEEFAQARKAAGKIPSRLLFHEKRAIGVVDVHTDQSAPHVGEVHTIGVVSEYRGRGFGEILLKEALELLKANGSQKYKLTVAAANEKALSLYKKSGFKIRDTFTVYQLKLR